MRSPPETKCVSKRLNRSYSEPKVGQSSYTPKAQQDPLEVLCVKFEDNRTSTFRDILRKRNVHRRPNAVTSSFSPLRPCILNFD